jgi:CDP-diacylglycerol---glycerol-3-phosphate 3-phosphatidyltransferase
MRENPGLDSKRALSSLRREWGGYLLASIAFLSVFFLILYRQWGENYALRWLLVAVGMAVYLFVFLWRNLDKNRLNSGPKVDLLPSFGLANGITISRAVINGALAGFLFGPWPAGWLAWAPSAFYLLSSLMDYADGFVARATRRTTVLGELMDMKWDGTGMVTAVILSVMYGQTPVLFLLVGMARPLFLFGMWLRRRLNQTVNPIPFSWISRTMAGVMMGFLAVILMPVYDPPPTQVAAVIFMTPFLINFLRDWFVVTGQIQPSGQKQSPARPTWLRTAYQQVFPLVLRAALIILLVSLLVYQSSLASPATGIMLVAGLAILPILLGAAGRIFALAVLLMSGFGFQQAPLEWRYWLIMMVSTVLFLRGTGRFSLWKPEDWLIYHRAGERGAAGKSR